VDGHVHYRPLCAADIPPSLGQCPLDPPKWTIVSGATSQANRNVFSSTDIDPSLPALNAPRAAGAVPVLSDSRRGRSVASRIICRRSATSGNAFGFCELRRSERRRPWRAACPTPPRPLLPSGVETQIPRVHCEQSDGDWPSCGDDVRSVAFGWASTRHRPAPSTVSTAMVSSSVRWTTSEGPLTSTLTSVG
jgi:hypothetical protein